MSGAYYWLYPTILTAALVAALVAVGVVGYVVYYYVFRGLLAPVRKTRAKVLRKHQREYEVDAPKYIGGPGVGSILFNLVMTAMGRDVTVTVVRYSDYFVVFDANGSEQEFAVSEDAYIDMQEGDEGILSYKGSLFRYFLPLRSVPQKPPPS